MNPKSQFYKALRHTEQVKKTYADQIEKSIDSSIVYRDYISNFISKFNLKKKIKVINLTTSEAVFKFSDANTATLNFASYKYPGGGFIVGAMAQEEALCHDSVLYNIISSEKFKKEYEYNRHTNNNYGLYSNFAIYSPNVIFDNGENSGITNIITCAAPNVRTFFTHMDKTQEHLDQLKYCLYSRIKFILDIAEKNNNTQLILGAFGCGIFKNDPTMIAEIFKDCLKNNYNFEEIIFAIPDSNNNDNYKIFKQVFYE